MTISCKTGRNVSPDTSNALNHLWKLPRHAIATHRGDRVQWGKLCLCACAHRGILLTLCLVIWPFVFPVFTQWDRLWLLCMAWGCLALLHSRACGNHPDPFAVSLAVGNVTVQTLVPAADMPNHLPQAYPANTVSSHLEGSAF